MFQSKSKNIFLVLISLLVLRLVLPTVASAHCPLCVAGAGVGLSVSRWLGVDDSITGVWLAAVLGAVALWTDRWLRNRGWVKKDWARISAPLIYLGFFGLTAWSFYAFNDYAIAKFQFYLINEHAGQIAGLDKLTFGLISGGLVFYLADIADNWLIKRNGRVFFPYQRIIVSLGSMLVLSLAIYILINYYI